MKEAGMPVMTPALAEKIDSSGIIAVLVIDELRHALPVAESLLNGGVDAIELTLRTSVAMDAAEVIKKEFPEMTLGFGTVLTIEQIEDVVNVGADFAVAPGCNPKVIKAAKDRGLSFAPGIMSPTDIELALEQGCRVLKYFPAESSGGLKHLKSMAAPYQHLGLKFIPLGGCNLGNARDYLESPLTTAIGGTWLASRALIKSEDWPAITRNSLEIRELINEIKKK